MSKITGKLELKSPKSYNTISHVGILFSSLADKEDGIIFGVFLLSPSWTIARNNEVIITVIVNNDYCKR